MVDTLEREDDEVETPDTPSIMREVDRTAILDQPPHGTVPKTQKEDLRILAAKLRDELYKAVQARTPYARDWEFYRLYLKGDQLLARVPRTDEIVRIANEDSKRLRSVHNILRPTARSLVGKLTRGIPSCTVVPSTTDWEEQSAARVGDAMFEWLRRKEDMDLKYIEACEYLPWGGNAFFELYWDEQGGRNVAYCEACNYVQQDIEYVGTPCPKCVMQREQEIAQQQAANDHLVRMQVGDEVKGEMETGMPPPDVSEMPLPDVPLEQQGPLPTDQEPPNLTEANEGDIKVILHDPRGFYIQPGAKSIWDAEWCCVIEDVSVQEAKRRHPDHQEDIYAENDPFEQRFGIPGHEPFIQDRCFIRRFYEKPTQLYPEGRIITMVCDKIVDLRPMNFNWYRRFPIFRFGFDKNSGEFWYEPPLAQAWNLQREINHLQTQKREHVELVCKPKLLNPLGSRILDEEFTAKTGQSIGYNPAAGEPHFVNPPPMPGEVWNRDAELTNNVRSEFGITESEAGISPQTPNGRAMAIIEAEADQQLRPIIIRNNTEWRNLHRAALVMIQKMISPEKQFTIAGPDGNQTFSFAEMNLSGDYDVQIEEEDGLSRNPAVRLTQAADLANLGFYLDPGSRMLDRKQFARHAGLKIPDAGYDAEATERAAAQQIPYLIKRGTPYQPRSFDQPSIFAEELLAWLRGPGRREDPQVSRQVEQIWQFYAGTAIQGQLAQMGLMQGQQPGGQPRKPGSGAGGPEQSAPGGSINNPGHIGTDVALGNDTTDLRSQATGMVQNANRDAESQARVQTNHEG